MNNRITCDNFLIEPHNWLTRTQREAWLAAIAHDEWWLRVYGGSGHKPPQAHFTKAQLKHAV